MNFESNPHQPVVVNGWTISKIGNVYQAVNKHGERPYTNTVEQHVINWCRKNDAKIQLT